MRFTNPALVWRAVFRGRSRGAVALIFALSALPMTMMVGLAVDYTFYGRAQAQLSLAADAAAMHAARAASQAYSNGQTTVAAIQSAGQVAGQQWFVSQLGTLANGTASATVTVTYTASPSVFTANVKYSGSIATKFGSLFDVTNFSVAGSATASITNWYVEVLMLLDNSSSMLIGATLTDIVALEQATPCSKQSATYGNDMTQYSWNYPSPYGYGRGNKAPPGAQVGNCDPNYTGDPRACTYGAGFPNISTTNTYMCTNGGGKGGVPQAPCAFACHSSTSNNDYFGLARSLNPPVQLRLDVVQSAAADVISTLQSKQEAPNQFSVGLYQFNSSLQQVYPSSSGGEAGTDLSTAQTLAQNVHNTPTLTADADGNTNFANAATALAAIATASGDGTKQAAPRKNLFIVTDGLQDVPGTRWQGPMTSATNDQYCSLFWNKGFNVYVLYTPYLPLPNPYYLSNDKPHVEPTASSEDINAMKACARYPSNFFQASDPAAINTAMQAMLAAALNSAGRVAK